MQGNVTSFDPTKAVRAGTVLVYDNNHNNNNNNHNNNNNKKRWNDNRRGDNNNPNNQNRNINHHNLQNHRQENARGYATAATAPAKGREHGHFKYQCPQINGQQQQGGARRKVYVLGDKNAYQDPNVVTGTFLLNNHYVKFLFNSGADKSFVNIALASLLNITPTTLDTAFTIELANGKLVNTNTMIQNCTLNFLNHPLKIEIMSVELGSFNVIIGMEWLSQHNAKIICGKKVIHIPIENETLVIRGDRSGTRVNIISFVKTQKYINRGCCMFLAHITKKKSEEKRLKDVPIVRDFPEVFPEDLPGLPPH
ncbi:putative reverse transcriptase domain-containing protein [Tanacetum coccineum]